MLRWGVGGPGGRVVALGGEDGMRRGRCRRLVGSVVPVVGGGGVEWRFNGMGWNWERGVFGGFFGERIKMLYHGLVVPVRECSEGTSTVQRVILMYI